MAVFSSNLVGIAVARSLHYQFYSWYFHSLPYLLFVTVKFGEKGGKSDGIWTDFPVFAVLVRVSILLGIELCWNTYPSTALSSAMLHVFHVIVVCSLVLSRESEKSVEEREAQRSGDVLYGLHIGQIPDAVSMVDGEGAETGVDRGDVSFEGRRVTGSGGGNRTAEGECIR
ncbi:unnamed protein product [Anisakis simplex]|uniref:dolichyl-P-Man:Man5GlcNAc2-PP-dolichol alpha-1,3-mannosyltransferase n=1 Tax=Anisakis simplex TaxID=6269 RepID=A0A3P6N3V7_ANISI|nr:unnamed protein product [Anisakis simplex]